jgi:hypothetical protein
MFFSPKANMSKFKPASKRTLENKIRNDVRHRLLNRVISVTGGRFTGTGKATLMGIDDEGLSSWDDFFSKALPQIVQTGANRYLAKKQAEDVAKLEAKRMGAEIAAQRARDADDAKRISIERNEIASINREMTVARMPLMIAGLVLVGGLAYSIINRRRR